MHSSCFAFRTLTGIITCKSYQALLPDFCKLKLAVILEKKTLSNNKLKSKILKRQITTILLTILSTGLLFCQTNQIETIFVSTLKDKATELKKTKIYRLKKITKNSDFDYSKLKDIAGNIKGTLNLKSVLPIFEPKEGKYNYYQFIATFKGEAYDAEGPNLIKVFHDILIVKTDNKNNIIDAYQYTAEWGEIPFQFDLFRSIEKKLTLTDKMKISTLRFERTEPDDVNDKLLKEEGIIDLK